MNGPESVASRGRSWLGLSVAIAFFAGCGGASSRAPEPHAPTRAELVAAGCAPTWREAVLRVGPLERHELPQSRGYSLAQEDTSPAPITTALPEVCHYPEGDCRAVRYERGCTVYVDYRCGAPESLETIEELPCDRAELP